MSPFFSLASATFFSTTEPAVVAIRFSTMTGVKSSTILNCSVEASTALMRSLTLSFFQPSWVKRKAGVLSISTTRCSDQATSSAVTTAPLSNFWFGRSLKVKVLLSLPTSQLSATAPTSLVRSSAS